MGTQPVFSLQLPRLARRTRDRARERDPALERVPLVPPEPPHDDLELLAAHWHRALDAADRALTAAAGTLSAPYVEQHRRALANERRQTAELLLTLARVQGVRRARPSAP